MATTNNLNSMRVGLSLKSVFGMLSSKIFTIIFLTSIQGCNFSKAKPEKFQTVNDSTLESLVHYLRRINTEIPSDTIFANACEQPPTDDELVQEIINSQIFNGNQPKSKPRKYVPVKSRHIKYPCKGQSIYVSKYSKVTLIKLSNSESIKIIGQSMHDSAGSKDFALMEYEPKKYAFTQGHLCGSIQIEYSKDTMTAKDLLQSRIFDSVWHPIMFTQTCQAKQNQNSVVSRYFNKIFAQSIQ
jgi:hypothetical protein